MLLTHYTILITMLPMKNRSKQREYHCDDDDDDDDDEEEEEDDNVPNM